MSDHMLPNGTVLPFGLLSEDQKGHLAAFSKTHQNFALRVGVVTASYSVSDEKNKSKLCNEYDVTVIEQNEDRGVTTIPYRNCLSAEGLGSIADFFEAALRVSKKKKTKRDFIDTVDQNGATVLVLCLDGMSEKGVIIGALTHPNRETTITDEGPRLEGEYNGVNIKVEKDGSTSLTFRGATDNDGKIIDSTQGPTTVKIEKDGSYQVDHKTITQRHAKSGVSSLTADDNIENTTKKNFKVTATENIELTATKNFTAKCQDLLAQAEGSATIKCQSGTIEAQAGIIVKGASISAEAEGLAKIKASQIIMQASTVDLGGSGGDNVLVKKALFMGTGNLGAPVYSKAIFGWSFIVKAK